MDNEDPTLKEIPTNYPKEVIVSINTHGRYNWGEINLPDGKRKKNEDLELDHFVYSPPNKNFKVIYVSAVPVGIPNFSSKVRAEYLNELLKINFDAYLEKKRMNNNQSLLFDGEHDFFKNYDYTRNILNKSVKKIYYDEEINKLKTYANIENPTQEDLYKIKEIEKNITRTSNYFRHFDQSYSLKIFEQNDVILNKTYSTSHHEKINSTDYNNIKILNLPEEQNKDIYKLLNIQPNNYDKYNVSLKQIIEFLNNQGVEQIYIYDFSCGLGICGVPPRYVRRLRRREKMTLKKLPKTLKRYSSKRYRQHSLKNVSFKDVQDMSNKKTTHKKKQKTKHK